MDEPTRKPRHWREGLDPSSAAKIIAQISQTEPDSAPEPGAGCGPGSEFDRICEPKNGSEIRDDRALPSINGYEIHQLLGRGASGRVYLAVRRGSDRPVAIKLYLSRFDAGPHAQRATRELDLLSEIRHPNVVRVLDYGVHESSLWIATEFVDAAPLDDYCTEHALNTRQRVELLARVCEAVQGLHEFGVIHRDLKPSNILVDEKGQPTIIDLGIASLMGESATTTLTQEGTPIGTPAFMAPEQARGERAAISTRSDVYSLGAIGYLLLAGDTPHAGDATIHELIRRVAQDEPRDARAIEPAIPKGLAAVLGKAVRRHPAARYASAAALAADLRHWLNGEHVTATRLGPWGKATRWIGSHPVRTTSVISILLAASIIGGTMLTIAKLSQMPGDLRILEGGRVAILYARSGKIMKEWRSKRASKNQIARVIPASKTNGLGMLIVTSMHELEEDAPWDRQYAVWSTSDLEKPLWYTTHDGPKCDRSNLPEETKDDVLTQPEVYSSRGPVVVADIFPEQPGHEIATIQVHAYDPSVIRIHSIEGAVLFEAWHWGSVSSISWMPETRQLVFASCNNERPWYSRGYDVSHIDWPFVIGAIKPRLGERLSWVNPALSSPERHLEWYKYISPPEVVAGVAMRLKEEANGDRSGSHVWFQMVMEDGSTLWWKLDLHGETVGTATNDVYKARSRRGDDIPIERATLADWPPSERVKRPLSGDPPAEAVAGERGSGSG